MCAGTQQIISPPLVTASAVILSSCYLMSARDDVCPYPSAAAPKTCGGAGLTCLHGVRRRASRATAQPSNHPPLRNSQKRPPSNSLPVLCKSHSPSLPSLPANEIEIATTNIMAEDSSDADINHHQDAGSRRSPSPGAGRDGAGADDLGAAEHEVDSFNNNIPVFLDRTCRMIENVPDDVVCWSEAGDSFIIKQVRA